MGYLEGFYYNPRIDKPLLREHSEGLIGAVGLSRRRGGADASCAAAPRRPRTRRASSTTSSGQENFFLEMQPNGLDEQETVNGHLHRDVEEDRHSASSPPTTATTSNQSDARAHEILMCVQQKKTIHDDKRLHHRNDAYYREDAGRDGELLHAPARGAGERRADRRRSATSSSSWARRYLPQVPGPRRATTAELLPAGDRRRRGSRSGSTRPTRRGDKVDGDVYARAAGAGAGRHPEDEVPRLLPHRLGLHPLRQGARHPGRAGPRLGRRLAGRVLRCASPTSIRSRNKLLFERFLNPERVSHARLRRRLLHEPARRGHQLRPAEVRQGQRRPDRDLAPAQGAQRASATSRAPWRCRSPRPTRSPSSCPSRSRARRPPIAEAIEDEPKLKALYDESPVYRELLDVGQGARGAEPPRRQARRRRRHQRGAALGVRAVLPPGRRRDRASSPSTTRTTSRRPASSSSTSSASRR